MENKNSFQTIKTSLKSVVKNHLDINKLSEAAFIVHRITVHSLQWMKLYLLHTYNQDRASLPTIDKRFVVAVMKTICESPTSGRKRNQDTEELMTRLQRFHDEHYLPTMHGEKITYTNLTNALEYSAVNVVTMYENNIRQNYFSYIETFVNIILEKKARIEAIRDGNDKAKEKKVFCKI